MQECGAPSAHAYKFLNTSNPQKQVRVGGAGNTSTKVHNQFGVAMHIHLVLRALALYKLKRSDQRS